MAHLPKIFAVSAFAAVATLSGVGVASAQSEPGTHAAGVDAVSAQKCGFYEDNVTAWYNHCTSDGSHIWVIIDPGGIYRCLPPGISDIGGARDVDNAYYAGRTCST